MDILVNNAGRTMNKPLIDMNVADWDGIMAVNARGTFLHSREALRIMTARGGGTIVNLASVVSVVGMKDTAVYAASKGAIAQLTKVIAVEYGDRGVRANAVAAGVVETDILDGIVDDSRATLAGYANAHPIGRVAQPGGDRRGCGVPCLACRQLHHRSACDGRWGLQRPLKRPASRSRIALVVLLMAVLAASEATVAVLIIAALLSSMRPPAERRRRS